MTEKDDFDFYAFLVRAAWNDIHIEHARATSMWPPMRSPHRDQGCPLAAEVLKINEMDHARWYS